MNDSGIMDDGLATQPALPRSRLQALSAGWGAAFFLFAIARIFRFTPGPIEHVAPLVVAAGAVAGIVSSLAARTYYSGNPALAYALAMSCAEILLGDPLSQDPSDSTSFGLCVLAALTGLLFCITLCWAVDVKINFPRLKEPPPAKQIPKRDYIFQILPGTAALEAGTLAALFAGMLATMVTGLILPTTRYVWPEPGLLIATLLVCGASYFACSYFRLPGSLWAGVGPFLALFVFHWASGLWPGLRLPAYFLLASLLGQMLARRFPWRREDEAKS